LPKIQWFAATLSNSEIACDCKAVVKTLRAVPDSAYEEQLKSVVNQENLNQILEIEGAFYYDVAARTMLAVE